MLKSPYLIVREYLKKKTGHNTSDTSKQIDHYKEDISCTRFLEEK